MALRDLLASFTVNVDSKQLEGVEKKFSQVLGGVQKFAGYLVTGLAGTAVGAFVKSQVDMADQLNDTSQKLGIASDDLERWQYVAQLSGGSAEGMAASLGFLNKAIGQAGAGSKDAAGAFAKLGVSLKNQDGSSRELGDVLPDIVENFNNLKDQGEKTTVAMALFGRSGQQLIPMLNQGGAAAADLIAEFEELGGATPQAFIEQSAKINDQMDRLHLATKRLSQTVVAYVLPAFQWLIDKSTQLVSGIRKFEESTHFAERAIKLLAAAVGAFLVFKLIKTVQAAKNAGDAIKAVFGIGPQGLLIIAALVLLYLAFDDLMTLFQGGQSIIGDTLDKLLGFGAAEQYVERLRAAWEQVGVMLKDLGIDLDGVGGLFGFVGETALTVFAGIVQSITGVIQMIVALVSAIKAIGKLSYNGFKGLITGEDNTEDTDKQLAALSRAGQGAMSGIGNVGAGLALPTKALLGRFDDPNAKVPGAPRDVYAPGGSIPGMNGTRAGSSAEQSARTGSVTQSNQIVQNFNVDPSTIGGAVKSGLDDAFKGQMKNAKAALGGT